MQQGGHIILATRKSIKWEAEIDIGYHCELGGRQKYRELRLLEPMSVGQNLS